MSEASEYRQYAEEAMRWVSDCTDPKEKLVLISLARTWLQAAGRSDSRGGLALPSAWLADEEKKLCGKKAAARTRGAISAVELVTSMR
jgi:hypothetical protein